LLSIAEAIVSPTEIIKYFGEDAVVAKECEIAYNATYMALLWDSVATKNARLLRQGIKSLPGKLEGATWLNYLRCHDDIGFGFDDNDIASVGYQPQQHRKFLVDYFTGDYENSFARGRPFARNEKTGDARISGSLASLAGLQHAIEVNDPKLIKDCCQHIILLHSLIMSFGGIPLLYYGDETGTLNDYSYEFDDKKLSDSRWLHRPVIDWEKCALRYQPGTVENTIFFSLKKMISIRKATNAFADFNTRDLLDLANDALFAFVRYDHANPSDKVVVIANLSPSPQELNLQELAGAAYVDPKYLHDLWSDKAPEIFSSSLILSGFQFYWLVIA
jgi:amylosucrase